MAQHDKDAIRRFKAQGGFDDNFDPLSLEISGKEKDRMIQNLSSAKSDLEETVGRQTALPAAAQASRHKEQKMGLMDRILRFFVMLFTGIKPQEYERRQSLTIVRRELKKIKPSIFNFKKKTILESLAHQIYDLYENIVPFRETFDTIFSDKTAEAQLRFHLFFLTVNSQNPELRLIDNFSNASLAELVHSEDERSLKKKMDDTVHFFLNSFDESEVNGLEKVFVELINFHDLLEFNFSGMLRCFNSNFSPFDVSKPSFKEARYEGLVRYLKDLECSLLLIKVGQIPGLLETAKEYFKNKIFPEKEPDKGQAILAFMEKLTNDDFRPVINSIMTLLSKGKLTLLLRYIDNNPNYESHIYPRKSNFFLDFSSLLKKTVENRLAALFKMKAKEEIESNILKLFKIDHLPDAFVYSDKNNNQLLKLELPEFLYPLPLNFSLVFYKEKYFAYVKRVINKLLIDGSFRNSLVQRTISDEFYRLDDIYGELNTFLQLVSPDADKGAVLARLIQSFKGDLPSKKTLTSKINMLNQKVYPIMKKIKQSFQNIQIGINQVMKDLENPHPETIDNLKKISGGNNVRFLQELRRTDRDLTLFSKILARIFKDG